jgi:hypothetical protein
MTSRIKKDRRASGKGGDHESGKPDSPTSSYEVGYGKPPKSTRFKPGQTGNPRGRPRKPKPTPPRWYDEQMKALVVAEAYRPITVRDGEKTVRIPVIQAVLRSLALSAAKGQSRSQRMFTDLLRLVEEENRDIHADWFVAVMEYKASWEQELEDRKRTGRTGPEPLPHPDDIAINMRDNTVAFKGPMTEEEKPRWDRLRKLKADIDDEIAGVKEFIKEEKPTNIEFFEADLERNRRLREKICELIPD